MDRRIFKKENEELRQYLAWRRRGSVVPSRKGKGSFNRQQTKLELKKMKEGSYDE